MIKRIFSTALSAGLAWSFLSVAAPAPARAKDDLVIGITQYPATLHPGIESMLAKTYILSMALRPLTAYDAAWSPICMLCEQLPTFENGLAKRETAADGKIGAALTYRLRDDAFWGDGKPVSAADAVFTWEVGSHPQSGVANAELYRRMTKVEAVDAKTFVVHLDRLTFDYNVLNDFRLLPAHVEKPRFLADPAQYRNQTAYDRQSDLPGLYNGPFRIAATEQGQSVTLAENPLWKGRKPAFKRIIVRIVENTAAMEAQLLSGGIDMIAGELGLPLDQASAFAKRNDPRFTVTFKPGLVYEHLDVNLDSPILSDRNVRRALMLGLDRALLTRQLFDGKQPPAHSSVNPLDGVFADDTPQYAYDPMQAARLLDQAGWKMTGPVRRNAKGESLIIELATTAGNRSRELVAQVIQAQWKRLGVDVRLRTEPARVFFAETVTKRRFPGLAMFAWYSAPESVPRSTLHSQMIPGPDNGWAGQNYTGYQSPEMDALIDAIEVELDAAKRKELWRKLQHLYAADLPALPLFFRADAFVLPKQLQGLVPTGHQDPSPLWVEHWRWVE